MKKTIISILAISIVSIISLVSVIGISSILFSSSALANTYEKTINPTFTINDTLTLSLSSSDLVINNLMPGNASDSNIITINVLSNNPYGYTLNSSVGGTSGTVTYNNRDLNYTGTVPSGSTAPSFTSLDYGSSISSLNEFGSNQWGYSYLDTTLSGSNNNSTPTWSNYSGLPLYTDETNIATLKQSNTVSAISGDNIEFKLGARADNTQGSGEYRNIINFIVTGTPAPITFDKAFADAGKTKTDGYYRMQDMTPSICSSIDIGQIGQLIDTRSGNEVYYVAKLKDNRCWMLDNLRLGSNSSTTTLTNQDSNISAATYTLPQGITSGWNSYAYAQINAVYKNDTTTSYGDGSGKIGVYYNFCAASAGTYCYSSGSGTGDANYDVCPVNWRMPTGGSNGEYKSLYNQYNTTQIAADINSPQYNLSTPFSGSFVTDQVQELGAYWYAWSSTHYDVRRMHNAWTGPEEADFISSYNSRHSGTAVRCIANNS